jgi:hypothetical protein
MAGMICMSFDGFSLLGGLTIYFESIIPWFRWLV